jgi:hypothetical protein
MKQAEDDLTMDLIEGEPVKLTHTHEGRMKAMGYEDPKQRAACRHCKFVETNYHQPDTLMAFERHWCRVGGFRVKLGSCCREFLWAPGKGPR